MRYACLVYVDPTTAFDGSPESNAILDEAGPASRELTARGFINEALTLPAEAVTVRVRNGRTCKTDGPFMETKEVLAGPASHRMQLTPAGPRRSPIARSILRSADYSLLPLRP